MPSIRQIPYPESLPDFRNLGVTARALIAVNLLALVAVLLAEPGWNAMLDSFVMKAARFEPPLVASLVLLYALTPRLLRFSYWSGWLLVIAVVLVFTAVTHVALDGFARSRPDVGASDLGGSRRNRALAAHPGRR